jgi:hypothetical protein
MRKRFAIPRFPTTFYSNYILKKTTKKSLFGKPCKRDALTSAAAAAAAAAR